MSNNGLYLILAIIAFILAIVVLALFLQWTPECVEYSKRRFVVIETISTETKELDEKTYFEDYGEMKEYLCKKVKEHCGAHYASDCYWLLGSSCGDWDIKYEQLPERCIKRILVDYDVEFEDEESPPPGGCGRP